MCLKPIKNFAYGISIIAILSTSLLSLYARAEVCENYNSTLVTNIRRNPVRIGQIYLSNNSSHILTIRLYHPDAPSTFFTWKLGVNKSGVLPHQGQPITIGGDWGIQAISEENNFSSCIVPVQDAGYFIEGKGGLSTSGGMRGGNNTWEVLTEDIFQGYRLR